MTIIARLKTIGTAQDRRTSLRHQLHIGSSIGGEPVTIHDLSTTGMLIETAADLQAFEAIEIDLPEAGTTSALIVWNSGRYFGCEFGTPVSRAALSAARLFSSPASPVEGVQPSWPRQIAEAAGEIEDGAFEEEKAPLGVRLRVIFGGALLLWALIIWGIVHLARLINGTPG